MSFWQYTFSFLFVRDWHTGKHELSRPRLVVFLSMLFLLLVALAIISFLQSPVIYVAGETVEVN